LFKYLYRVSKIIVGFSVNIDHKLKKLNFVKYLALYFLAFIVEFGQNLSTLWPLHSFWSLFSCAAELSQTAPWICKNKRWLSKPALQSKIIAN
jgi:hypothetical protein